MRRQAAILAATICVLLAWSAAGWAGALEEGITLHKLGQYQAAISRLEAALAADSSDQTALRHLAACRFELIDDALPESLTPAIVAYEKLRSVDPDDPTTWLRLGRLYQRTGDAEKAREYLAYVTAAEPRNAAATLDLAELLLAEPNGMDRAAELVERVRLEEPKNVRALRLAAAIAVRRGDAKTAVMQLDAYLAVEPGDDAARFEYAQALSSVERFEDAIQQFHHLGKHAAWCDKSLLGLATAYYHADRQGDALAVVAELLKSEPQNTAAWRLAGRVHVARRRHEEAAAAFGRAIELNPRDSAAKLLLARALASDPAAYEKAVAAYRAVIEDRPNDLALRIELAALLATAQDLGLAIEQYRLVLEKNPTDGRIRAALVRAYLEAGEREQAVIEGRLMMEAASNDPDAYLLFGRTLNDVGEHAEAILVYETLLADYPANLQGRLGLGWAHHRRARQLADQSERLKERLDATWFDVVGRYRRLRLWMKRTAHERAAMAELREAARRYPATAEPHLFFARVFCDRHECAKAAAEFEAALKVNPEDVDAWYGKSRVLHKMGRNDEAVAALRRVVELDAGKLEIAEMTAADSARRRRSENEIAVLEKNVARSFVNLSIRRRLAALYAGRLADLDKAAAQCELILTREPADEETRLLLARIYARGGRFDDAWRAFGDVLERRPDDWALHAEAMDAKVRSGRASEAIAELRTWLTAHPRDVDARLVLAGGLLRAADVAGARREYGTVLATAPQDPRATVGLAKVHAGRGENRQARDRYRQALAVDPDIAEAYFALGVFARREGAWARAVALQREALVRDVNHLNARAELAFAYKALCEAHPDRLERYQVLLAENPGQCELRFALAQSLQAEKRSAAAAEQYETLLRHCPTHAQGRRAFAGLLEVELTAPERAIAAWREVVAREPLDEKARLHLARLAGAAGDFSEAIEQLRWCERRRPDDAAIHRELTRTLLAARHAGASLDPAELKLLR